MPSSHAPAPATRPAAIATRAHLERLSEPWSLNRSFAIAITLILAMFVGSWVATGQFELLILVGVWFAAVMIIVFVRDYWWAPALVITAGCFGTAVLGFNMSGLDIGVVILLLTFPVKLAMKTLRKAEPELDPGVLFWMLIGYVTVHAVIILFYSRIEGVELKNIIKHYYGVLVPLVFYGLLIRYCAPRTVKPTVYLLFTVTLLTICASIVTMLFGLDLEPLSNLRITIDWLSQEGADGILRGAPVLLIGSLAFWPAIRSANGRLLLSAAILISAYGVVFSGGRIPLASCLLAGVFFAFTRRKLWLMVPFICVTLILAAVVTTIPNLLYSLPVTVQRGLTPLNFSEDKSTAEQQTEGSDEWHKELRDRSFDYWMADTNSFYFGHGFKAWDDSLTNVDEDLDPGDHERRVRAAIETGGTENMFSQVTNVFGAVGMALYLLFYLNLAWRLWSAIKACPANSAERALCEFSFVSIALGLLFMPMAGGVSGTATIYWTLGLLAARPYIAAGIPVKKALAQPLPSFIPKSLRPLS